MDERLDSEVESGSRPRQDPKFVAAELERFTSEPIMVVAFSGWNDAGGAATGAVSHLADVFSAELTAQIDSEEYVDFQVNRPAVVLDPAGNAQIEWPNTQFLVAHSWSVNRRLIFVQGVEPSLKWRSFSAQVLKIAHELGAKSLLCVGALLSDSPHTRPLEVSVTSPHESLCQEFGITASTYEGPAGILSVLANAAGLAGLTVASVWGNVPHYVAGAPSPKATAAIVTKLELLLGEPIDRYELDEEARQWQMGVDVLAGADPEIAAYVKELEEEADRTQMPQASGDVLAKEFEQYLKRQSDEP